MPVEGAAAAAAEIATTVAETAAKAAPAVASAAEGAASAGATGAEVAAEGAVATTQGASTTVAEQAANAGLVASTEKTASIAGPEAGLTELAWGKPEPVGTTGAKPTAEQGTPQLSQKAQIASIEASLREGEAQLNALERSGASKDAIAEAQRNLETLEQQRGDLTAPAEPSQAAEAGGQAATTDGTTTADAAEPVEELTTPPPAEQDENLPIADRLSSAKSVRDAAEEALDKAYGNGTSTEEIRNLERTFRKSESQYRDLQAESDRTLSEVRLSSMEQRLTTAFEAKLTQVIEAIGKNNTEAFSEFKEYVDEKDPKKKEALWVKILVILAAVGKELLVGSGVSETVQQGTTPRRR